MKSMQSLDLDIPFNHLGREFLDVLSAFIHDCIPFG